MLTVEGRGFSHAKRADFSPGLPQLKPPQWAHRFAGLKPGASTAQVSNEATT
jgi:hypothetical protein